MLACLSVCTQCRVGSARAEPDPRAGASARAGEPAGNCCYCTSCGCQVKVLTHSVLSHQVNPCSATVLETYIPPPPPGDSYFKHLNWYKFSLLLLITIRKTSQEIPVIACSLGGFNACKDVMFGCNFWYLFHTKSELELSCFMAYIYST